MSPGPAPNDASLDGSAVTSGFTLIELLVVIAILATLTAVAAPRLANTSGPQLHATARALAADLRLLRDEAVRRQVTTALTAAEGAYLMAPSGRSRRLPVGEELTVSGALPTLFGAEAEKRIGFFPDGSSTGGTATVLVHGGAAIDITVSWLNGRVNLRE